jgi:hypothetical protein
MNFVFGRISPDLICLQCLLNFIDPFFCDRDGCFQRWQWAKQADSISKFNYPKTWRQVVSECSTDYFPYLVEVYRVDSGWIEHSAINRPFKRWAISYGITRWKGKQSGVYNCVPLILCAMLYITECVKYHTKWLSLYDSVTSNMYDDFRDHSTEEGCKLIWRIQQCPAPSLLNIMMGFLLNLNLVN